MGGSPVEIVNWGVRILHSKKSFLIKEVIKVFSQE